MIPVDELKAMNRKGINFYVDMPTGGSIDIAPEEVSIYMTDEDAFWARHYGISKEIFSAWYAWRQAGAVQCTAKTTKGKQCGNMVPCPDSPVVYDPTAARCTIHDK